MTPATLAISAAIISVAYFISAVTGYGSAMLALPLVAWITGDLHTTVIALLMIGGVQACHVGCLNIHHIPWRETARMLAGAGVGLPVGYACGRYLPQTPLLIAMGVILLAGGASGLAPGERRSLPRWLMNVLLVTGGIMNGAFACGGATLVVYAQSAFARKEEFRAALMACWVVLNLSVVAWAAATHALTGSMLKLAGVSLPLVLVGGWLGELVARRMKQHAFGRLVALVLVISGLVTVVRVL
jgi:uncharacterized protein